MKTPEVVHSGTAQELAHNDDLLLELDIISVSDIIASLQDVSTLDLLGLISMKLSAIDEAHSMIRAANAILHMRAAHDL